jgi:hypothetical protein
VAGKIKTWVVVVLGAILAVFVCIVAVAGAGFYFFTRHIQTREASPATATRDFDEIRSRFTGQKALVELDAHGNFVKSNPVPRTGAAGGRVPEQLNVLAFDADEGGVGRVVRVTIPFWLLRLKTGGGSIDFNGKRMNLDDLRLSVEDLERYGPTLIVDHSSVDGNRVLVWSQ